MLTSEQGKTMGKIINYIAKGQGLGIKYLLLFTLIVTVIFSINIKLAGEDIFVPTAQEIADQFLPIKIENGEIVEPLNVVKKHTISVGEGQSAQSFDILMDTTTYNLDPAELKDGIYITRSAVYTVNNGETRVHKLENSLELPSGDYTELFSRFFNWGLFIFGIFAFLGLALFYFIAVIFYATCSYLVSLIMRKKYDYDLRMRLSTLAFITTYVVFSVIEIFGFSSSLVFFLAVLALQSLVMKNIPEQIQQQ